MGMPTRKRSAAARPAPPKRSQPKTLHSVPKTPATATATPAPTQRQVGGCSGRASGEPAHSPAASAAAKVATTPPAAGSTPCASYRIRLAAANATTPSASPASAARASTGAAGLRASRLESAVSSTIIKKRGSFAGVGGKHLAYENGVVAARERGGHAAVHPGQRLVQHGGAGALRAPGGAA